jgi:hypothetical protein
MALNIEGEHGGFSLDAAVWIAGNDSYRFRHSSATAQSRIKAREQAKRGGITVEPF